MRKTSWRIAQAVAGLLILILLIRNFQANWATVRQQPIEWSLHWELVAAAVIVTWAMYGLLIWGWRAVLQGWRQRLRIVDAARIWTISSLGKYIPGKVWSIAGMAVMAQQRGVAPRYSTGSAVIMQLISIATGAVLALVLAGPALLGRVWGGTEGAMLLAAVTLLAALALTSPSVTRRIAFVLRRPDAISAVEPGALAAAVFANLVAWGGYGLSLELLSQGVLRDAAVPWGIATGAFAASYVTGYLALFLPGGLGVREVVLVALLQPTIGLGAAAALAAASRIVLTFNEVGAAVPFLLFRRPVRDAS